VYINITTYVPGISYNKLQLLYVRNEDPLSVGISTTCVHIQIYISRETIQIQQMFSLHCLLWFHAKSMLFIKKNTNICSQDPLHSINFSDCALINIIQKKKTY